MKNFLTNWKELTKELYHKHIILFLDYDGTLAPIAAVPSKAVLPHETRKLLNELVRTSYCSLAIISGRTLGDIKRIAGVKGIIYSGNHGLEMEGPEFKFKAPVSRRFKDILKKIKHDLEARLSSIKGVLLEDKSLSLSLHYRLVNKKDVARVKTIFHESVIFYLVRDRVKIRTGKMVLEVRPPGEWDKGRVVLWILARQKVKLKKIALAPIYIGDDKTDEDAFRALKGKGMTIFVGRPGASSAKYYLRNTKEVMVLLKRILEQKER